MPIDRIPRKGEKVRFDSMGMFPNCDNREYFVLGKFRNYRSILNIQEIGKDNHTQIIVKFLDGFNKYLHFVKQQEV